MKKMEERILRHIRVFCDCMEGQHSRITNKSIDKKWSSPRNLSRWTSRLTFDVMGDLAFGQQFDTLKSDANRWILDVLPDGVHGLVLVSITLWWFNAWGVHMTDSKVIGWTHASLA